MQGYKATGQHDRRYNPNKHEPFFITGDPRCLHIRRSIRHHHCGTIPVIRCQGQANMAKTKATKQTGTAPAGDGQPFEKLTNKAEAIRRALAKLGNKAMPTEIQEFIKSNFGVEMTTKVISVYKSKLVKKKGKPGRKPQVVGATTEAAPKAVVHGGVTFKDLRTVKEIRDRLGPARMRELVELVA